ncbi:unnamed protein product [Cuscuta campestris]|uniref:CCHC-type domain-containing protein n=1 Tax=Cuscuta campestris TaxID=132261 RepID=A0A484L9L6_9ASTE|nr:unnamed protein product [Cuscuta campestris]
MAGAFFPPPPPPVAVVYIEKLRNNGAEEFLGDQIADPMIAKQWFERTIRVLGNLRVPQDQRGDLAHFVEAKREEFLKFTQGELTLPEYCQKFDELAGCGQDLVPTMEKRCKRFVEALRLNLSAHLITPPRVDINALFKHALDMNAALIKKAEYEQMQGASAAPSRPPPPQKAETSSKRSFAAPSSSHQSKKANAAPAQSSASVQKKGKSGDGFRNPICNHCGRRHPGECWFTQGMCLGCGQARHFRRDCPKNPGEALSSAPTATAPVAQPAKIQKSTAASSQPKRQASSTQAGKPPARTYAMWGRTEQPAHDVIMGIFTLFDTSITALIDPGSTLSYVCLPMPVMPNISREDLDNPVIVSNLLGHSLRLTHVYHNCPLVVHGKIFPASLIELPHREFDVILGMDWLTANQAVVDCGAHTVRLRAEDGSDVLIRGELLPKAPKFISYIHARRLIRKKCEAFLCTVRDTRQEAPSRGDIPTTMELVSRGENLDFAVQDDILYYRERMVVPAGEVRERLLREAHSTVYTMHPGGNKMFHDLRRHYWWPAMKREITEFTSRYRSDPSHVIPADTVTLDENLTYEEEPVEILAREIRYSRRMFWIMAYFAYRDKRSGLVRLFRGPVQEPAGSNGKTMAPLSYHPHSSLQREDYGVPRLIYRVGMITERKGSCAVGQRIMEPDPDDWVIGAADDRQCGPDYLSIII